MSDTEKKQTCFVIMPISKQDTYEEGHFSRVYSHLIKPACKNLNLEVIRADDIKNTNYIIIDILKRIVHSDIVICDLSAKNPNVMYELGIRQAFNLPTVLIKDIKTERIFDIQGLRTIEYDDKMRVDLVEKDIINIQKTIEATIKSDTQEVNSLIQLLEIPQAELSNNTTLSVESTLILEQIRDVSQRLTGIEDNYNTHKIDYTDNSKKLKYSLPNGESVDIGDSIYGIEYKELGFFRGYRNDSVVLTINSVKGNQLIVIDKQNVNYNSLTTVPF